MKPQAQIERLTIPIYNIGGAVSQIELSPGMDLVPTPLESISQWHQDPFVARVVPATRRNDARISFRMTRRRCRKALYNNDRRMEDLYTALALFGIVNDSRVEAPYARYSVLNVQNGEEQEVIGTFLEHPLEPRLGIEIHPHNAVMFDRLSHDSTTQALRRLLHRTFVVPATRYALSRWYMAKARLVLEDSLVDAWIGLEGLYLLPSDVKASMYPRLAQFLYDHVRATRPRLVSRARQSYNVRNEVVHGDVPRLRSLRQASAIAMAILRETLLVLLFNEKATIDAASLERRFARAVKRPTGHGRKRNKSRRYK